MTYFFYMVRCADNSLYSGITTDIERRTEEHNGQKKGAKYTKKRQPITLVYHEEYETRSEALKREYAVKQLSKEAKEDLISSTK